MKRWLVIFVALAASRAFGQEESPLVIVAPLRAIGVVDAELNLDVERGENDGENNASAINEKIRDRDVRYPIILGGGGYDIEATIGAGVTRSGWSLRGSGVGQEPANPDGYWMGGGQAGGAQGTRLFWNKRSTPGIEDLDRVLIRTDAACVLVDGIDLRGTRRFAVSGQSSGARLLAMADEPTFWSAGNYPVNSFVKHGDEIWRAHHTNAPTAADTPGSSARWIQAGYQGHIGIWHQSANYPTWSSGTNYAQNTIVTHNGTVYIASGGDPAEGDEPGIDSDWVVTAKYKAIDRQNGPLILPSLSFGDLDIGILAGPHSEPGVMVVNGAGNTPADENTAWADTIQAGYLQFHRTPVCVWIRTIQSVSNQFKQLYGRVALAEDFTDHTKGGNAVLWAEFAGETVVDNIQCGNHRTAARVGYLPGGPVTVRSFRFDGGSITHGRLLDVDDFAYGSGHGGGQNRVTIENGTFVGLGNLTNAMDSVSGDPIRTWSNSTAYAAGAIVYWNGDAWEANASTSANEQPGVSGKWDEYATWFREPIVHWGPGMLTLSNVNGLGAAATKIRLNGATSGANNWASVVVVENCLFSSAVNHPDQIIDADSLGPYMLIWRNCGRRFGSGQNNRIEMFRDGHHISAGHHSLLLEADSNPVPPPWELPE